MADLEGGGQRKGGTGQMADRGEAGERLSGG